MGWALTRALVDTSPKTRLDGVLPVDCDLGEFMFSSFAARTIVGIVQVGYAYCRILRVVLAIR